MSQLHSPQPNRRVRSARLLILVPLAVSACDGENGDEGGNDTAAETQADSACTTSDCDEGAGDGMSTGSADAGIGMPSPLCERSCSNGEMCGVGDKADCLTLCMLQDSASAEISEACYASHIDELTCVADLTCEELNEFLAGEPGHPCQAESDAVTAACE